MAGQTKKGDAAIWILLVVIAIPVFALAKLHEAVGTAKIIVPLAILTAGYIGFKLIKRKARMNKLAEEMKALSARRETRIKDLSEKYRDSDIIEKIMSNSIWQGQSAEQLTDSLGAPEAVDDQVLKTKKKEVWKYRPQGGNRYNLRITLENDFVIGWDSKS